MKTQILSLVLWGIILTGLALAHEDHDKKGGKPDTFTLLDFDTISINGEMNFKLG